MKRTLSEIAEKPIDISTETAHYKPLFGLGDDRSAIVRGIARYGELTLDPGGTSQIVNYPDEEQVYFILEGQGLLQYGTEKAPVKENDFMYLPAGVSHGISNPATAPCRLLVMGFKIPPGTPTPPALPLRMANGDEVAWTPTHGPGSLFKLLMGNTGSRRDKLACARVLTSLFIMELAPGIDNQPHHHDTEEEIYFILRGHGEILTGEGPAGLGGRYPAQPGDAFFFRLNATVGFARGAGDVNPQILAVRSLYPFRQQK
ncbi:MAG TPA: cupin domain-containing protein [bacterium]|nr:cupin domain-containing protein [bacterium]